MKVNFNQLAIIGLASLMLFGGSSLCHDAFALENSMPISPDLKTGHMRTSIAINGFGAPGNGSISQSNLNKSLVIDSSDLIAKASELHELSKSSDIEEDPHDRFYLSRSGKLRPAYVHEAADEWAEEVPLGSVGRVLERVKRCGGGGGGGDDDDGDANRARRMRRVRRRKASRASKASKGSSNSVTTITKTIYDQNGQVVSQTSEQKGAAPAATLVQASPQAAAVVPVAAQAAGPIVQHTVTTHTVHVQTAPAAHPAPTVVHAASPVVNAVPSAHPPTTVVQSASPAQVAVSSAPVAVPQASDKQTSSS